MPVAFVEIFDQYLDLNTTDGLKMMSTWGTDGNDFAGFGPFLEATTFGGTGKQFTQNSSGTGGDWNMVTRMIPPTTQVSFQLTSKFNLNPANSGHEFLRFRDGTYGHQCGLQFTGQGKLRIIGENNANLAESTLLINSSVIYRVNGKINIATGAVVVYVNGVKFIDATGLDLQDSTTSTIEMIELYGFTNPGISQTHDSILMVYDEYVDIPELELTALGPNGDTADEAWTLSSGTDSYALVDELPANTSDYVSATAVGAKNIYDFTNESRVAESVFSVSLMMCAKKDESATRTLKQILKVGGVEYDGANHNQSQTWTFQYDHWRQNPNTAAAWVDADIDGIQAGHAVVV